MTKTDERMLAHLMPVAIGETDLYFCYVSKYVSEQAMYNNEARVKAWVERNGGTMTRSGNLKYIIGDRKGFYVRIRFPSYTKRDMKNIMATIWIR